MRPLFSSSWSQGSRLPGEIDAAVFHDTNANTTDQSRTKEPRDAWDRKGIQETVLFIYLLLLFCFR